MSSSVAPLFPKTSVFIPAYWENARSEILTQEEADARYLKFPVGQGTESIPNLIVAGTSTLGITSTTQFTATTGSYGEVQSFYKSTSDIYPLTLTTSSNYGTNDIKTINIAGTDALPAVGTTLLLKSESIGGESNSNLYMFSGSNTLAPRTKLQSYITYGTSPTSYVNEIDLGTTTGNDLTITNGNSNADITENKITLHQDGSYANNYIQLRVAFDYISESSVFKLGYNFFNWSIQNLDVMNINASADRIELRRNMRQDTRSDTGDNCGILETGIVNTTTSATNTTLSFATNAFRTTINTPAVAGRIFTLPTTSATYAGYWFGICNKSTSFTIAVQVAGVTIYTIPVATNATNGGSSVRFAVGPSPYTYFRVA